jgi:hypothetical protein
VPDIRCTLGANQVYLGPNKYFVASDVGNSRQQWYGFQLQKEGMADNVNNKETLLEMFKVRLRARWVTLRARWVTLIARWVTLRARWVTLRARWVTLRARWVTLRARWVTLRARWVTLRARWVTLRARWVTLRAHWVTLRARWVTLRARWVTLRARWVTLRARWVTLRARWVTLRARWVTLRAHDVATGTSHHLSMHERLQLNDGEPEAERESSCVTKDSRLQHPPLAPLDPHPPSRCRTGRRRCASGWSAPRRRTSSGATCMTSSRP